jgi:RNA polymerase sigma-70 factor (ECF subfamily)
VDNFEKLANQHKDAVYRQMVRVCGNREDAEDVLIEALLKAYRNLNQLRDVVAFRAWLGKIAQRVCWQLKQKEALMPLLQLSKLEEEGREISQDEPSMGAKMAARQTKQILDEAIRELPELYAEVYRLRDIDELSGGEVARRLGISGAAMKSRLHRARELLRQRLDRAMAGSEARS